MDKNNNNTLLVKMSFQLKSLFGKLTIINTKKYFLIIYTVTVI